MILCARSVPSLFVRLLLVWYRSQTICVKWGTHLSAEFFVTNRVIQGSLLSPRLFNLYIDELSNQLACCPAGCAVGSKIINHFAYADDLVFVCPSAKGLQKLLKICELYGSGHDIVYNCTITVCMRFIPDGSTAINTPKLLLNSLMLSL